MTRIVKRRIDPGSDALVIVYTRIRKPDLEELQRREVATGAPVAAQIRILVHDGLRAKTRGFVK